MSGPGTSSAHVGVRVVIDANIIIKSPRLNSGTWRAALHAQETGSLLLRVPEVALLEAVGWFRRELPLRVDRFRRAVSHLEHMGVHHDGHPWYGRLDDADGMAAMLGDNYESYLRDRIGAGSVLPIPDADHRKLVTRAIRREKPFSESGDGYRDALIWENVCSLAADGPLIFVSENTKDFAGKDGGLAADLQSDLESRGLASGAVSLRPNLLEVITQFAPDATDARSLVEHVVQRDTARRQLENEFNEAFSRYEGIRYPQRPGELDPLMVDATVEAVWDVKDVEVRSVKPTGDATYLVVAVAKAVGRAYSVREGVDIAEVYTAQAAVAEGRIDDAFQRDDDLVLIKNLPLIVEFEVNLDPAETIWNAGVVAVWPCGPSD